MISIRRALRRFASRGKKISSFDVATEEDLYYCYRLLLGREPDQEGWDQGKKLLDSMEFPLAALVDEFLSSPEYRANRRNADQPVLVELDEFKIYIRRNDYFIGAVIEKVRGYEPHVTAQVRSRLREGDVFVDIGANIGYFTLLAAKIVGPEGQVHAFEPLKNNLDLLSKSLETNALENVHVHPYAVAEKRTTFQLELSGSYSNCRVIDLGESTDGEDEPEITIEAFPLDERLKDCRRIDLIKMDIEGAEARAWRGMSETIQRLKPMVIFEFSPLLIRRISHIEPTTFLAEIINSGYELYAIDYLNGQLSIMAKPERIMELWERSGLAHVDLLARPLV